MPDVVLGSRGAFGREHRHPWPFLYVCWKCPAGLGGASLGGILGNRGYPSWDTTAYLNFLSAIAAHLTQADNIHQNCAVRTFAIFRLETVEKPTDNKASRRFATRTDASFRL